MSSGWIGVDFDGTLAHYEEWISPEHCGAPVPAMVQRVKSWRAEGREVRIFTARIWPLLWVAVEGHESQWQIPDTDQATSRLRIQGARVAAHAIRAWCHEHLGEMLPLTCVKDPGMIELYDDRCVQVRPNTGELVGESTRGLA